MTQRSLFLSGLSLVLLCSSALVSACKGSDQSVGDGDGDRDGDGNGDGDGDGDGDGSGGSSANGDGGTSGDGDADGGTSGEGGAGGAVNGPDPITLVPESAQFVGYGAVSVEFSAPVDVGSIEASLLPAKPAAFALLEIVVVDETTLELVFDQPHLPRDYTLTISGTNEEGNSSFELEATLPGLGNGARAMFLSKETGLGDLRAWEGADPEAASGLEAADDVCQSEAEAAGLTGTFIAYLSDADLSVFCRIQGLTGTVTDQCGQEVMPSDTAPILNTHGLPLTFGADDLIDFDFRTVVNYYADSTIAETSFRMAHGTNDIGDPSSSICSGWEDATTASRYFGANPPSTYRIGPRVGPECDDEMHISCIQTGGPFFETVTAHEREGKQAFVSTNSLVGMMAYGDQTGIAAADLLCQDEAKDAGLVSHENFKAYLSSKDDDALCHIVGGVGRLADDCGFDALPDVSWVSVDGYPVGEAATLVEGPTSPLLVTADGTHIGPYDGIYVWTGTNTSGAVHNNCGDFATDAGTGVAGTIDAIRSNWAWYAIPDCGTDYRVYCFEN